MKKNKKHMEKGEKGGQAMQATHQGGINPVVGAAVGAAIGGVVGGAAAVAMSDPDTRKKVVDTAKKIRDKASERFSDVAKHAKDTVQEVGDVAMENVEEKTRTKTGSKKAV